MKILNQITGDGALPNLLRQAALDINLTEPEFCAFCDANNGTVFSPDTLEHSFHINVEDSGPDGLAQKWGIDLRALVEKLHDLTPVQKCALLAALDGFFDDVARGE